VAALALDALVLRHPAEDITPETIHRARHATTFVKAGTTAHFAVEYQQSLGAGGASLAQAVLTAAEGDYSQMQAWFGGLVPSGLPFTCLIVKGSFGAFHATCQDTQLHLAAFDETNGELVEMVAMAELVEVFSADQSVGWDCGASNGEGLSRVLATELHPIQLDGFATAEVWLNANRPNFVDQNDPTDRNAVSTGCAVLFLNYLHYQLGHGWTEIVTNGQATLAATYASLTGGKHDGWQQFSNLLATHYPPGNPVSLTSDNVFPL
jgi:hypothetical protein